MSDSEASAGVETISSYESLEVNSKSSYEDEEIVLQESEYETVEEEIDPLDEALADDFSEEDETESWAGWKIRVLMGIAPKSPIPFADSKAVRLPGSR